MQVKIYVYDDVQGETLQGVTDLAEFFRYGDCGAATLQGVSDLAECFPDDAAEYRSARAELNRVGRYWCGGGAAPLTLLMRA